MSESSNKRTIYDIERSLKSSMNKNDSMWSRYLSAVNKLRYDLTSGSTSKEKGEESFEPQLYKYGRWEESEFSEQFKTDIADLEKEYETISTQYANKRRKAGYWAMRAHAASILQTAGRGALKCLQGLEKSPEFPGNGEEAGVPTNDSGELLGFTEGPAS
ncbi:hypothetical protein I302_100097 [Kwoniella bestiolae CBS 10118]|uniref:Uncharacterized protein n=1 Tax=Kwoniella bestiolae CBS 10118 TaxID=1296100 RepID=A0A1B9G419_9TREE|nr:hypothetical protein I302_03470 [Kwoniella bestiolae CBS 10118]OCF25797.1 hypothetical protein I302_03470 [Kwoniella bestiolae CBS 10118]